MAIFRLAYSNFFHRRMRALLTVLAVTLSVSLVVATTSGYKSAEAMAYRFFEQFIGATDVQVIHKTDVRAGIPEALVGRLRADEAVETVAGRLEGQITIVNGDKVMRSNAIGVLRPEDKDIANQPLSAGQWFDSADGNEVVIDQAVAKLVEVGVGDALILAFPEGKVEMRVVGIVHKPGVIAAYLQTVYMPLRTLQRLTNQPDVVSRVLVNLKTGEEDEAFNARWQGVLASEYPMLKMKLGTETRDEMDKNLRGMELLSYLGGTVSMLAATFIIFSALSMGVTERSRMLAMLRAVGAYRAQLGMLVVMEGLLIAALGVASGVPLGIAWVHLLANRFPDFFEAGGVVVSVGGVIFAAVASLLTALIASFLPAWLAMRTSPLEAMTPSAQPPRARTPIISAIVGLLLVGVDPLLLFSPWSTWLGGLGVDQPLETGLAISFYGHFLLGLPSIVIGFFLLTPLFVWLFERLLGPLMATLLMVKPALLRQQLSSGIWRAAGTCAALMIGLAILVAMQTQGETVLNGWKLPEKFPDMFIVKTIGRGFEPDEIRMIESVPGIRNREVTPIAIARAETDVLSVLSGVQMPDATMFIGVDPDKAFDMMELDFRHETGRPAEGDERRRLLEYAREKLKLGGHVVVTDEFRQLRNLGIGDRINLATKQGSRPFVICGVVWSPGMDVIINRFDMASNFEKQTAGSVFGSLSDAKDLFGVDGAQLLAANIDYGVERDQVLETVREAISTNVVKRVESLGIVAGDVRQIKADISRTFRRILLMASTVAFAAMGVAAMGVTNTIMASVRTRQWQFGILRSIGLTRGQLLRLVLSEALLLGLIGCALGIATGLTMSVNAKQLLKITTGYVPPVSIPWAMIGIGAGLIMLISLLASLWPAISTARAQPLALLQAGRSAA